MVLDNHNKKQLGSYDMDRQEYFIYQNKKYPKGTVVIRKHKGKETREVFLWHNISKRSVLVISPGCYTSISGVPRACFSYDYFCSTILRFEDPTECDLNQVAKISNEYSANNRVTSNDGIGVLFCALAICVGTLLFPPIGLVVIIYAFSRK